MSSSRHDSSASTIGCASRSFSSTLASVDSSPFGVFFPGCRPSWSYRIFAQLRRRVQVELLARPACRPRPSRSPCGRGPTPPSPRGSRRRAGCRGPPCARAPTRAAARRRRAGRAAPACRCCSSITGASRATAAASAATVRHGASANSCPSSCLLDRAHHVGAQVGLGQRAQRIVRRRRGRAGSRRASCRT